MDLHALILAEIKRLAGAGDGRAPGSRAFELATGIKRAQWLGVFWARWSDAVLEAGCTVKAYQQRYDTDIVLTQLAGAARHYGHLPTVAEMRLYRRQHPTFPNDKTISRHFPTKSALAAAMRRAVAADASLLDVLPMLPQEGPLAEVRNTPTSRVASDGWVYLIKSGNHYKIGRGDDLERRVKQIRVALPEAGALVHAIRTDDPPGIEAYWHRRFDAARMNGEWFNLTSAEVAAFKRRKFM